MKGALKAVGAYLLHKIIKNRAVKRAEERARKDESLDGKFYISFRTSRKSWKELEANVIDQDTQVKILKLSSLIKNSGGSGLSVSHSETETRIYFDIPRTAMSTLTKSAKSSVGPVSRGEVKVN